MAGEEQLMAKAGVKVSEQARKRPGVGPGCPIVGKVTQIGEYFEMLNGFAEKGRTSWYRGQGDIAWTLTPSVLRFRTLNERSNALGLLADFKRYAEVKIPDPPAPIEELKWVQLAQHHGLPTRLLDWTKCSAMALYFACCESFDKDGAVFVLDPIELNRKVDSRNPRVFDANADAQLINSYFRLGGQRIANGKRSIAINPVWNCERIMRQTGVFTLHGSRDSSLTSRQVNSLKCLRICTKHKKSLLADLEHCGVNEMSLFPELEHLCSYLKKTARIC
jgi:hypothetical protein